ncbi:uncharacterized protein [Diadema antillarum]|uniref:uncharacterized protein n=1 Tax=Diadema antillarum TaxID=105358 RepID=UPI003A871B8F
MEAKPEAKLQEWEFEHLIQNSQHGFYGIHQVNLKDFIQRIEPGLKHLSRSHADSVRIQITQALTSVNPTRPNLTRAEKSGISSLREDNSIHILKANKGNATVVMDKEDYETKVHILMDTDTYKILPRDPTPALERRMERHFLPADRRSSNGVPTVPYLFMENFEETALQRATLRSKVWLRYVDGTFVVSQHGTEEINNFLQHLNSLHPSIKFNMEIENRGAIPSWTPRHQDTTGTAQGSLSHQVYRKPTHTDRYLNYRSYHHPS